MAGLEYIKEASCTIPRGFELKICKDGVIVSRKSSSGIYAESRIVPWINLEYSRINPITLEIERMT